MTDVPQAAKDAATAAVDELPDPDSPFERDRWNIVWRVALEAAAPHIAAAERERIRQLAVEKGAFYAAKSHGMPYEPFADLLTDG